MTQSESDRPDPRLRLLTHARWEAAVVLAVWGVFLVWVVGFSYLRGYQHAPGSALVRLGLARARDAADFSTILGMPDWVFHGIAVPWLVATVLTIFFGLRLLADDDLGVEMDDTQAGEGA